MRRTYDQSIIDGDGEVLRAHSTNPVYREFWTNLTTWETLYNTEGG